MLNSTRVLVLILPIHSGLSADVLVSTYDLVYHEWKTMVLKLIPFILSENQTAPLTDQISTSRIALAYLAHSNRICCHGPVCRLNSNMRSPEGGDSQHAHIAFIGLIRLAVPFISVFYSLLWAFALSSAKLFSF